MEFIKYSVLFFCLLVACAAAKLSLRRHADVHEDTNVKPYNDVLPQDAADNYADFLKIYGDLASSMLREPELYETKQATPREDPIFDDDITKIPFTCPIEGPQVPVPTSVHRLKPGDIGAVAALGDSITAGNGIRATNAMKVAFMNRGESFSVGGDRSLEEGVITLPNILKKYNRDLMGESYCGRTKLHALSGYNVALPGATNLNLEAQARELIHKFAANLTVFYDQWKVITLLIGGNDLCQHCARPGLMPEDYKEGIRKSLDLLHQHVPRAFVNLVIMADVSAVPDLIHVGSEDLCDTLHAIECACANRNNTAYMRQLQVDYYEKVNALVETGVYDTREDFTVVVQPYLRDQKPLITVNGTYDMRYFAPDCFHPSYKCHQFFAYQLWNAMLTKYGEKPFEVDQTQPLAYKCPTSSSPYFYTKKNSVEA